MNIVKEYINFERGKDPKEAMKIGLRPKMSKMLSFIHMESRDAEHEYFGSQGNGNTIHALKSVLWYMFYDGMTPDIAFEKSCKSWEITARDQKNLIKDTLKRELNMVINETLDFERGREPKTSMGIGKTRNLKEAIDKIYEIDKENSFIRISHGNVFGIDVTDKVFIVEFYSNALEKDGKKVNRKKYAAELVSKTGIAEYFWDMDSDYKTVWHIRFKIKKEYWPIFKEIKGWYDFSMK